MEKEIFFTPPGKDWLRIKMFDPELYTLNFIRSEELRRRERGEGPDIALTIEELGRVLRRDLQGTLSWLWAQEIISIKDHPEYPLLDDQQLVRLTERGRVLADRIIEAKREEISGVWKSTR